MGPCTLGTEDPARGAMFSFQPEVTGQSQATFSFHFLTGAHARSLLTSWSSAHSHISAYGGAHTHTHTHTHTALGWVAQLAGTSSWCASTADLVPSQGTHKNQSKNA